MNKFSVLLTISAKDAFSLSAYHELRLWKVVLRYTSKVG